MKPQYVDQIPRAIKGSVQSLLDKKNEMDNQVRLATLSWDSLLDYLSVRFEILIKE